MTTIHITTGNTSDRRKGRKHIQIEALWSDKGLAVHQSFTGKGWAITHLASGYAIRQNITSHRNAITVAKRLLDAGDWTRSKTAITTDARLKDRAFAIITEARLLGLVK